MLSFLLILPVLTLSVVSAAKVAPTKQTNVIVSLTASNDHIMDYISNRYFDTREERLNALGFALKSYATLTQAPVLKVIQETTNSTQKSQILWISNQIFLPNASPEIINKLSQMSEVSRIEEDRIIRLIEPTPMTPNATTDGIGVIRPLRTPRQATPTSPTSPLYLNWGIHQIRAPNVWKMYNNIGDNVIVANIDSGVNFAHEALRANYRGLYGWFDAYVGTSVPNDIFGDMAGHGTHVMGTIAGKNGIGVAPGAKWMACKGCQDDCAMSALIACGQWITCPTLWNGKYPNCAKAPHVVNNSWGGEGGQNEKWYDSVIKAWRAAGIIPIFAAGNSGPGCGTINYPSEHPDVITVGATDWNNTIAYFSSKGPTVGATSVQKPDVSAPGIEIRSAGNGIQNNDYEWKAGTSMAAPHVTGVVALILSQKPKSTYVQIKNNLVWGIGGMYHPSSSGYTCGSIPETTFPNNIYGAGVLNAEIALFSAIVFN